MSPRRGSSTSNSPSSTSCRSLGIAVLVRDEVVDELRRTLGRVDAPDVEQVRRAAQAVAPPERVGVARSVRLHADADDLAGRRVGESLAHEVGFLGREERERVGRTQHLLEDREAQRRFVVRGRVQQRGHRARARAQARPRRPVEVRDEHDDVVGARVVADPGHELRARTGPASASTRAATTAGARPPLDSCGR